MQYTFRWDKYSDQPHILKREDKKELRKGHGVAYFKLIMTNLVYFPYLFLKFLFSSFFKSKRKTGEVKVPEFYGLCVNLDKGQAQYELVEELGVKSLQIRVFLNDMANIDKYVAFAKGFGEDKEILITIIQDREHIENHTLLQEDISIIFEKFRGIATEFMVGNAVNRIKWSFVSIDEYLRFYQVIQGVRDTYFKSYRLIGSSVIDFEYHFTIRTLFNGFKINYDKVSALLYVDRRGSPYATQMGLFDLHNKIAFLDTIVRSANKSQNALYITETNWPLTGTAPYAPTSEKECVSEALYTRYMLDYFAIALQSQKIEKVYWHQLIAPGYGLVDNREGILRKTEAFERYKEMIGRSKSYHASSIA